MLETVKRLLSKLPIPGFRAKVLPTSEKTSQALRQLIRRYNRQKRLWIYIILSSVCLVVMYVMFILLWEGLWSDGGVVPVTWIIFAGLGISIFQTRRCNQVIKVLREACSI
ncbi:MAG: hypothetical protein O3B73_02390 [bacterium]|nr:hypothetical protein [bacterium]